MAADCSDQLEEIRKHLDDRGDRVLLRPVRRHVRAPEREARSRPRTSTTSSRTAPASPGFAAGEIGQVPSDPDIAAMPDLDSFTPVPWQPNLARFACDVTVEGEAWPYCPRTILRRACSRRRARAGLRVQDRASSSSTSSCAATTTASIELADPLDTLEKPCYDITGLTRQLRLPHDGLEVLQRARLGQLRERPRGRERPVRAELHLRRRARRAATARSSSATWCTPSPSSTGMLATFMPKPFTHLTGNGCHFHMSLWTDGHERLPRRGRPARARPLGDRLPLHRRPEDARARLQRASRRRPSTRTSGSSSGTTASGATWSPVWISLRLQQPHADAAHPRPGPDRGPDDRRLVQPVPRGRGRARRRPRRDRARGSTPGEPNSENLYTISLRRAHARAGSRRCRRTCSRRRGELERDDVLRAALGRGPGRGLRRLLRPRQARRVAPLPRAGDALGDRRVPDALLSVEEIVEIRTHQSRRFLNRVLARAVAANM